ncbi:hypothetical protein DM860_011498 [Cuscuta australis]|uniref:Uncharacterized protein n=1 Tax=Cuscuta australis TaxID=267555 RepID=A0A328CZV4_9ASTE|nr:hypothetical protein DM860_011498 [Cuscuta australis]
MWFCYSCELYGLGNPFFSEDASTTTRGKDVALARLGQSRIILVMILADHRGKKYKFIEDAQALVRDVHEDRHFFPWRKFLATKGRCSNILLTVLLSSFEFVNKSLGLDEEVSRNTILWTLHQGTGRCPIHTQTLTKVSKTSRFFI